jgi:hypothetical protein
LPSDHEIIAVNADPVSLTKELLGTKRRSFITQSQQRTAVEN